MCIISTSFRIARINTRLEIHEIFRPQAIRSHWGKSLHRKLIEIDQSHFELLGQFLHLSRIIPVLIIHLQILIPLMITRYGRHQYGNTTPFSGLGNEQTQVFLVSIGRRKALWLIGRGIVVAKLNQHQITWLNVFYKSTPASLLKESLGAPTTNGAVFHLNRIGGEPLTHLVETIGH